jgi:hypothetical protein
MARSPLEQARNSLNIALRSRNSVSSQAHSLDSIACSLLHIAENMPVKTEVSSKPDTDQIELVVRRLMDDAKAPTVTKPKGKK